MTHPHHYAVVVGISKYPGLFDLEGPADDADRFTQWLRSDSGGGVPEANIANITKLNSRNATALETARPIKRDFDLALHRVNRAAEQAVASNSAVWSETRLYIYAAGHGIQPREGRAALLMADAQQGWLENIELSAYAEYYEASGTFRELVIIADCCRRWAPRTPRSVVPFDKPLRPAPQVLILTGLATSPGGSTYEHDSTTPNAGRGQFTAAIIDGLTGRAELDEAHGCITSATLLPYVEAAVLEMTRDLPESQTATIYPPIEKILFPLATTGRTERTSTVRIFFPAESRHPAELLMQNAARLKCDPVDGEWTVELPPGIYGIVRPGTYEPAFTREAFLVTGGADVAIRL